MPTTAEFTQAAGEATKSEDEPVERRHRILIAAAVAAVLGSAWITDIRPAAWTRRRRPGVRQSPAVRHASLPTESEPEPEDEEAGAS